MNRANGMSLGELARSNAALARPSFEFVDPVLFMATLNRKALKAEKTVKAVRNNRPRRIQFNYNRLFWRWLSLVAHRGCAFRFTLSMRRSVESQKIVSVIGILAPFSTGAVCVSWLWL